MAMLSTVERMQSNLDRNLVRFQLCSEVLMELESMTLLSLDGTNSLSEDVAVAYTILNHTKTATLAFLFVQ